jgi:hypothetical protein
MVACSLRNLRTLLPHVTPLAKRVWGGCDGITRHSDSGRSERAGRLNKQEEELPENVTRHSGDLGSREVGQLTLPDTPAEGEQGHSSREPSKDLAECVSMHDSSLALHLWLYFVNSH